MMNAGSYVINTMNPFVPLESFLRQCMELVNFMSVPCGTQELQNSLLEVSPSEWPELTNQRQYLGRVTTHVWTIVTP